MRPFLAFAGLILGAATQAAAQTVTYDVRPGGGASSPVQVPPGAVVTYEVTITVSDGDNDGLLLFICDLLTDLGVDQSTANSAFDPLIAQEFDFFPSVGVGVGDDILSIGASQGFAQGATTGIGQGGVQVLVRGELQTAADVADVFQVTVGPETTTQLITLGGGGIISDNNITTNIGPGFVIETGAFDADGDAVADELDNCPNTPNPGQEDGDGDQVGDVCDNCPRDDNPDQEDCDGDQFGDVCELNQGQPVYRNAGPSAGSVSATAPQAQDVHLAGPAALHGFEVSYALRFSTALNLTVILYQNDAANTTLPPAGLIGQFNYLLYVPGGEGALGASFQEPVEVPTDLWFEVTLSEPSDTPGFVELLTTEEGPTVGSSDGVLYDREADASQSAFVKFSLFTETDCDGNQVVDGCETDTDGDQVIDACEDCPDEPELSAPSEPDAEVTCDDGIDNDCDGLTDVDDGDCTAEDCNNNGTPDDQDIAAGTSRDCQPNGVPDECEADGDGDGVPDDCDNCPTVFNMSQMDSDGDAVGDACEEGPAPTGDGEGPGQEPPPGEDGDGSVGDGGGGLPSFGGLAVGAALAFGSALMGSMLLGGPLGFFIGLIFGIVLALMSLFGGLPSAA